MTQAANAVKQVAETAPPMLPSDLLRTNPFVRCARAAAEWSAHTLLALVIIACNSGLEWALKWLNRTDDPKFFDLLPMSWIFHAADVAVLVALSVYGVRAAIAAYRDAR